MASDIAGGRRILHLIDSPGPGGAESICVSLAAGLAARGHDSFVTPIVGSWTAQQLASREIPMHMVDVASRARYRERSGVLAARRCEVIQAHLLGAGVDAAMLTLRRGTPSVVTFHGPPDFSATGLRRRLYSLLLGQNRVRVVTVSRALADIASDWLRMDRHRITVIPNGVDVDSARTERNWSFRRSLGISDDAVVLGAIGNFRMAKRHDLLVDTLILLRSAGIDAHAIIIGEHAEPLRSELLARAEAGGAAFQLHLPGFRTDVAECLPDFDVFLSTSDVEGFSLALVQAMGAKVPVVSTRSGGPQEILDNGQWGSLVPTGDAKAMAFAVRALLNDPALVAARRTGAHAHAIEHYALPAMLDAYELLYTTMLAGLQTRRAV